MLLAALVALAQLSSAAPFGVQLPAEPAPGHPLILIKADPAHHDLEQSLAAALRAGGIATLQTDALASMTRADVDNAALGARLFACEIGSAHLRWPASRPPSGEVLIFPRKVSGHPQRPRLIIVVGHASAKHQRASDTWLPVPQDLSPESDHTISEAVILWILARSGATSH